MGFFNRMGPEPELAEGVTMANRKQHSEIVEQSHRRSVQYGIEKSQVISKRILNREAILDLNQRNSDLIRVTAPLMNDLYDFLAGTGYILVLTDREGCILNIIGDKEPMAAARELDMVVGAYMDEKSVGTNAMGTAISENAPVQISATEHFITAYHRWTCSAAPIHDGDGTVIGTLNFTGESSSVHPHTLGIVVAAVRSVEFQLWNERVQNQLVEAGRYNTAITNSISHGIVAVNRAGSINSVNRAACTILSHSAEALLNCSIGRFVEGWGAIAQGLADGVPFEDHEVSINVNGKRDKYLFSAFVISAADGLMSGVVLTLKEIQKVINLVNRFSGMQARYTLDDIIGKSPEMCRILAYAERVADSPSTILIEGESGTGKEVLAQAIHNRSSRSNGPFVAINCGAIHRNLIESELFGYDEGSFTGAKKGGQPGKFELASGGTLFLDEIGEMPLEMQVNLLRVLQEGYVTRVGGSKTVSVDVRIIAATNRDLKCEIGRGNFRQDLYYRIGVIPIRIPPLRDRREDIDLLTEHFIRTKAEKLGKSSAPLPESTRAWIAQNTWPGNIRELENFIEKYLLLGENALPEMYGMGSLGDNICVLAYDGTMEPCSENRVPICSLDEMERRMIAGALKHFDGHVTKAAEALGISRNTLYVKMKKFNL